MSVAEYVTVSGARYQPFAFAARSGVAETTGAVASYFSAKVAEPVLPAASEHDPETEAELLSGPPYVFAASQETPPLVASLPSNDTCTGARYQPFAFGPRSGVAETTGAVASYLNAYDAEAELPAASEHAPDSDAELLSGPL